MDHEHGGALVQHHGGDYDVKGGGPGAVVNRDLREHAVALLVDAGAGHRRLEVIPGELACCREAAARGW